MSIINADTTSGLTVVSSPVVSRSRKKTRVISITSGKGGVGKTTVTTNMALALVKQGFRVLVLDADLGLANVNIMLGFEAKQSVYDVLVGHATIDEVIVHHDTGIDIIPATSGVHEVTSLGAAEKQTLIAAFSSLNDIYDYVFIDTSAGIGSNVQYFNCAAESVIIVVDPEPTSMTDAYALMKILSTTQNVKEFEIIVNRANVGDDGREIFRKLVLVVSRFLDVKLELLGAIQIDKSVVEAIMRQIPLLSLYPSTRASRDICRLAKKIEGQGFTKAPRGGLQFFFESLLD